MMMRGETPKGGNAHPSWSPFRPDSGDYHGDLAELGWNDHRRVEASDPGPTFFDDTSQDAADRRREGIRSELERVMGLLGGRSERTGAAELAGEKRQFQAGALGDGDTVGDVQHMDTDSPLDTTQ